MVNKKSRALVREKNTEECVITFLEQPRDLV